MINKSLILTITTILTVIILGCSNGANPIGGVNSPDFQGKQDICAPNICSGYDFLPVGVTDFYPDGSVAGGMGALGLFDLYLNPYEATAELISLRSSALTDVLEAVDITNFLQLAPCTDCVKIKSVSKDDDGNMVLSIGIRHPFGVGDPLKPISGRNRADLHVFNVEGIVLSDSPITNFPNLGVKISSLRLLNADGFTGYLDNSIDNIFPTEATVHPYILHFDDYSTGNFDPGNPMGFASVTTPPPYGNLVMAMGCDYDYKDYVFQLSEPVNVLFAVGCTYAVSSAAKMQRFTPEYRIPQHNKKAASEVRVNVLFNNLQGENTSSTAEIEIQVVDINHGVPVGSALNEMLADSSVKSIRVEIPGVMLSPLDIAGNSYISGSGHDSLDPLLYLATITNTAGALEGTYKGMVKVLDNYSPGQNTSVLLNAKDGIKRVSPYDNPLTGLFAINEFATYQTFDIDVGPGNQIQVINPNGGETLWMAMSHEITWDIGGGTVANVKIEWSTDNFVSDIRTIVDSTPNTGSYIWKPVPVVDTSTAKIRISDVSGTESDKSDNYFSIKLPVWLDFQPKVIFNESTVTWGWYTPYSPYRDYISPAIMQTTTGVMYIGFYGINYGTESDDCFVRSNNGTSWYGSGGMWNTGGVNNGRVDNCKVAPSHNGYGWMMTSLWGFGWWTDIARGNGGPAYYTFDGVRFNYSAPKYPEIATDAAGYIFNFGDNLTNGIYWCKSNQPGLIAYGGSGQLTAITQLVSDGIISKSRSWARQGQGISLVYYTLSGQIKIAETTNPPQNTTWDTEEVIWSISNPYVGVHTPALCSDSQGRLFAAWVARKSATEVDILASMRVADGQPWSTPAVVYSSNTDVTDVAISSAKIMLPTNTMEDVALVSWNKGDDVFAAISPLNLMAFLPSQQVDESGDVARQQDSMCMNKSFGYQYDVIFAYSISDSNWDIAGKNANFKTP